MTNPYFLSAFEGIASVADQYDIDVVFYNSDRNPEKEIRALKRLKEMQVQGIIIAPTLDFDNFQSSQRFGEAMNIQKYQSYSWTQRQNWMNGMGYFSIILQEHLRQLMR